MDYASQAEDVGHLLLTVLDGPGTLAGVPGLAEVDADLARELLVQMGQFVDGQVAPLHRIGDEAGCRWKAGEVHTPEGFRAAYQAFWQAGWPALACDPADGGQGLPWVFEGVLYEWLSAANHGWTMAPGLLHGAYECLKHHGSEALRARYLAKIASGEWLATMCLTESQAGSDLGLVRTRALPQTDGSVRLNGTKIFISGGEHDLSDNIVHLVLARLPDAPPGPKGLSLFLAPKWFMAEGEPQRRNAVVCERIEEKMGLHGSPTCVMRFDEAVGWLVGEAGKGLAAMFVMMNAARLHVALQGIGLLDAAWQKAQAYALERRQMRTPASGTGAGGADPIIGHPAVARLLDTQRAWVDGGRWLAYRTGLELDLARHHPDADRRAVAQTWCSLLTPVLKAAWTDQAFAGASACLQVLGGHGYVREWGLEQIVRDARITMVYEGTNEIQANDLLLRKLLPDGGAALRQVLDAVLDSPAGSATAARRAALDSQLQRLGGAPAATQLAVAGDVLRQVALLLLEAAWQHLARAPGGTLPRWETGARALWAWVLPECAQRALVVEQQLGAAAHG